MYMVKSVYFGVGITELSTKQCNILKKIYETPIVRKLGLGAKFLRKLL